MTTGRNSYSICIYITTYILANHAHGDAKRKYSLLCMKATRDMRKHWGW